MFFHFGFATLFFHFGLCSGICPVGFTDFTVTTGSCLYLSTDRKSWFEARDTCVAQGAKLVEVESQAMVASCAGLLTLNGVTLHWIGLNDILYEDDFRWTEGGRVVSQRFGHFQPNGGADQNCWIAGTAIGGKNWQDKSCSDPFHYICQYTEGDLQNGHFRQGEMVDVEISSTSLTSNLIHCAVTCLQRDICDGYSFNGSTSICSVLKLKENDVSLENVVRTKLSGSQVFLRRG